MSDGPCKCLRISRSDFAGAVDASTVERRSFSERQASTRNLSANGSVNSEVFANISGPNVSNHRKQTLAKIMQKDSNHSEQGDQPIGRRRLSLRFAGVMDSEERPDTSPHETTGEKTFDA